MKTCVGLAGISFEPFWGFEPSQYKSRIAQIRNAVNLAGAKSFAIGRTFHDSAGAIKAARQLNEKADLVILDVATYPEGNAALAFFDALKPPVALWSRKESKHATNIGHNSFCGANFLAGNLALRGQSFRKLYGPATSKDFRARLSTAVKLIGAAKAASGSTIGMFGDGIVPKFYDIDIQSANRCRLEKRWNIRFVNMPTKELLERAKSYTDKVVDKDTKGFLNKFSKIKITSDQIHKQLRLLKALREISKQQNFASIAIRCWPELQKLASIWPCPSISILNDEQLPTACEGDPGGALDMLLAKKLNNKPSTLLDVVDWDDKNNTFSIWHCGPTACSWAGKDGVKLLNHNVDGRDANGKPAFGLGGIVDMYFAPGNVTLFRTLGAVDDEFVVQGKLITEPNRKICGSFGLLSKPSLYGEKVSTKLIRDQILNRALPHHFTTSQSNLFF